MPVLPPSAPAPSISVTALPTPTVEQAMARFDGMRAALLAWDVAGRDTCTTAHLKPKVTTYVLDDVEADTVTEMEVTLTQDSPVGPGSATFAATVNLTRPEGESKMERHCLTLITTPKGFGSWTPSESR